MKQLKLSCLVRLKKYKSYRGEVGKITQNIFPLNFKIDKPNKKWVMDVTEFSLFVNKIYLSPILDLYNGEIIIYNIFNRLTFMQTIDILENAFLKDC